MSCEVSAYQQHCSWLMPCAQAIQERSQWECKASCVLFNLQMRHLNSSSCTPQKLRHAPPGKLEMLRLPVTMHLNLKPPCDMLPDSGFEQSLSISNVNKPHNVQTGPNIHMHRPGCCRDFLTHRNKLHTNTHRLSSHRPPQRSSIICS